MDLEHEGEFSAEVKDGWYDDTTIDRDALYAFLMDAFEKQLYNIFTELHYSGGSAGAIIPGSKPGIESVQVFRKHGNIDQILVCLRKENGSLPSIYLSGKAMENFLATQQEK